MPNLMEKINDLIADVPAGPGHANRVAAAVFSEALRLAEEEVSYLEIVPCPDGWMGCLVVHRERRTRPRTREEIRDVFRDLATKMHGPEPCQ